MTDHRRRIDRVTAHVRANLGGDLSLDALAEVAAMSRFHWHRVHRALTGETVAEAVRRARLNRAAVLVAVTDLPLARVAAACGYPNLDSFARAFRTGFGHTPAALRRRRRVAPALLPRTKGTLPMFDVTIRDDAPAELAALPHHGAYPEIGRTFGALARRMGEAGLRPAGPAVALYYDEDPFSTPVDELRSHAGLAVAPGTALPDGLDRVTLDGGRTAVLLYKGPYEGLQEPWTFIYRWLANTSEEPRDAPPYERYLNGPDDVAPGDLLTEVCVPLRG